MKKEYDFSKAEKGRFSRAPDQLQIPIYLDKDVTAMLRRGSKDGRTDLSGVVNGILRKQLELIEMLGRS